MAKRTKANITKSPQAKKFFDLFIKRMIGEFQLAGQDQGGENELQRRIEMFFCKDTRHIWLLRATEPFVILGPAWATPDTPMKYFVEGAGQRQVKVGDYLWVRHDTTKPNITEVEFQDQVFQMQTRQWNELQNKCQEVI